MEPIQLRSDLRSKIIAATPAVVFAAIADPQRIARWWGPEGFTNTIHKFNFVEGGSWLLTMHGPDGKDYPNESRFTRLVANQVFEIEHLGAPHFFLTVELVPVGHATEVTWCQTFDTAEHFKQVSAFVAAANEQNLARLSAEAMRSAA